MKISEIKINKSNPRFINDDRFNKLVKSVQEFPKMMKLRPIVLDSRSGNTILGGNMRFRALICLGYKDIPDEWIVFADELTEEEKKRFVIEDNMDLGIGIGIYWRMNGMKKN